MQPKLFSLESLAAFAGAVVLAMVLWPGAWFSGRSLYSTGNLFAMEPWASEAGGGAVHNPELGDEDFLFFPQIAFVVREMHENGHVPLWNPHIYCGVPLDGNPQIVVLNPFLLALAWFQEAGKPFSLAQLARGLTVMGLLRFVLAAGFAYLWLVRAGSSRLTAGLLAAMVAAGPYASVWWYSTPGQVFSIVPMVLFFVTGFVGGGGHRQLVLAALALALSHLGGYPQTSILLLAFVVVYAALMAEPGTRLAVAAKVAVAGVASVALVLGSWLPFLTYLGHSAVSGVRAAADPWLGSGVFTGLGVGVLVLGLLAAAWHLMRSTESQIPWVLVGLVFAVALIAGGGRDALLTWFPMVGGTPFSNPPFPHYIEAVQDSVGALAFVLILAGAGRRHAMLLGTLFVLLFTIAKVPPFYQLVRYVLPLLEPTRLAVLVPLVVALLLARTVRPLSLLDAERQRQRLAASARATLWLIAPVAVAWVAGGGRVSVDPGEAAGLAFVAWLALGLPAFARLVPTTLALAVVLAMIPGFGFHPAIPLARVYPQTPTIAFLERETARDPDLRIYATDPGIMNGDEGVAYGLSLALGWDGMDPSHYVDHVSYLAQMQPRGQWRAATIGLDSRLFDLLATRYVVMAARDPTPKGFAVRHETDAVKVVENPHAAPRAFVTAGSYDWAADKQRILTQRPEQGVAFVGPPPELPGPKMKRGSARISARTSDSLAIETDTDGAAWLVVLDNLLPGWHAEVDGKPAELHAAYNTFRTVAVPAGKHVVVMYYRPLDFWVGIAVALVTLVLLVWQWFRAGRPDEVGTLDLDPA